MEPVWNHMLTCDYERTRPTASPLEWDLYTRSLLAWPATLMNVPEPYGRLRRPGIVDIDEDDHHRLLTQWHTLLRHDDYVPDLIARTTAWHRATEHTLERAEQALNHADRDHAYQHLGQATRVFLDVMSTHIVNWLLPEDDWNAHLATLFGDAQRAANCLLALMTPSTTGHLLTGHLQQMKTTATSHNTTTQPSATQTRERAGTTRDAWEAAALLAAAGTDDTVTQIRLIAALCAWAATSEESRAVLRARYLDATRRWASLANRDITALTTRDLHPKGNR